MTPHTCPDCGRSDFKSFNGYMLHVRACSARAAGPDAEQMAALMAFALANGHTWKSSLRHAWETGNYRYYLAADEPRLQQIRNNFGPSWLAKFKLSQFLKGGAA